MKKVIYFFFSLFAFLSIVLIGIYYYADGTAPNYNFSIKSSAVSSEVEIIFDDNAVPHIYAETEKDAMYALGYVHATERLWQMDLIRHVGAGELSELFGEKTIDNDKFLRTIGINKTAKQSVIDFEANAPENVKVSVKAYLDGINTFIAEGNLPIEYKILQIKPINFEIIDVYRSTGYMAYSFAMALKTDPIVSWIKHNLDLKYLEDLPIHLTKNHTTIPVTNSDFTAISESVASLDKNLPVPQFIGSNSWVISGDKTKSGKVIFANDAHIAFASPSVWYEAHIITPEMEYYGNHLASYPFPLIGHTKTHSWGITMFENDDIDLYKEKIEGGKYLYGNEWKSLKTRTEIIKVKGGEPIEFEISETDHGPIINEVLGSLKDSEPIAMWWIYNQYEENKLVEGSYLFSRGSGMEEVREGASLIHAPGLNIMYGDEIGNIAWWASAKLPIRSKGLDSKEIIDGTNPDNDIKGWYDFSKNPQAINPERGYVYSANNAPDAVDGVNYQGYYYDGNSRAKRIIDAIEEPNKKWTIKDVQDLQLDEISLVYAENLNKMISFLDTNSLNNEELELLKSIKNWTGTHSLNETTPTVYYKWMYNSIHSIYADEFGKDKFKAFMKTTIWARSFPEVLSNKNSAWWDNVTTPEAEDASEIITKAFIKSNNELTKQLGSSVADWKWKRVHTVTFGHALGKVSPLDKVFNIGPFEVPSGKDALNKLSFPLDSTGVYKVTSGPSMRIAIDFADVENSESIIPTGQSGNVMSPYYSNQAEKFVKGIYRKQRMNKEDILANKTGESKIVPNNK
ncbi:MAG: penicillin acylase family protein [Flavobacteriales bacterium]|nr:penicillin acylase family protein [Flavobacteriales bacterium]